MTYHHLAGLCAVANAVIGLATVSPLNIGIAITVAAVLWATRA